MEFNLDLFSQRSYLKGDKKFKKKVLNELEEVIDLKAAVRSYIESISTVHDLSRSIIRKSVSLARKLIENAHQSYAAIYKGSMVGFSVCEVVDNGKITETPLLLNWDDIRLELQRRNRKLTNLSKRFVTNIIKQSE